MRILHARNEQIFQTVQKSKAIQASRITFVKSLKDDKTVMLPVTTSNLCPAESSDQTFFQNLKHRFDCLIGQSLREKDATTKAAFPFRYLPVVISPQPDQIGSLEVFIPFMHLFIFDINGVLAQKRSGGKPAILRPYVRTLLESVLHLQRIQLCRVALWTSMTQENAQVIIDQLLTPKEQTECLCLWSRNQCTPHPTIAFKAYKDLTYVWDRWPQFDKANTFLFDDNLFKGYKQPQNVFLVSTFVTGFQEDTELLRILDYIQTLVKYKVYTP